MTDKLVKWMRGELPMGDDCIAPDRICVAGDCECDSANKIAAADRIESQLKLIDVSGKINNQLMELVLEQKNHIDELEAALREIEMLHYDSETDFYHDAMKAHDIARAALGEKSND